MQERLQWIKMRPRDWIHAQPSIGGWQSHGLLVQRYPKAACQIVEASEYRRSQTALQLEPRGWRTWLPGALKPVWRVTPMDPEPADLLWANMQLHIHPDPQTLLNAWYEALRVDGFLMFSCLGPDSLLELHQLYRDLGWPPPGPSWTDMHDWGDMLVQIGFAEPVMDMERITLQYAEPVRLIEDLRAMGRNLHPERHPACRGKGWRDQLENAIRHHWPHRGSEGQYALTFEIVYGHALKPAPKYPVDTTTRISLGEMKRLLRPD